MYTETELERLLLSDGYNFWEPWQRIIAETLEQGEDSHFQKICEGAFNEYKGDNHCAYNVARSLVDAKRYLQSELGKDHNNWTWRNVHATQYTNLPWSRTPLRSFFHRSMPFGGNTNTPNVKKFAYSRNADDLVFKSTATANYRMVVTMGEDPS